MAQLVKRCLSLVALGLIAACSEPSQKAATEAAPTTIGSALDTTSPALSEAAEEINIAVYESAKSAEETPTSVADAMNVQGEPEPKRAYDPVLVKLQVLLDRAHFPPGSISGQTGDLTRKALAGYEASKRLPADGDLDPGVWARLTGADGAPIIKGYVLTPEDVQGPFVAAPPRGRADPAAPPSYERPSQALAEKFRMDEALLLALNPDVQFTAGTPIMVPALGGAPGA